MVTPEIVRPMEADEVPPVPGFEVTQPNDLELFRYGRTQGNNDTNVYQLAPYGHGSGVGVPIGYGQFNPQPASPMNSPSPGVGTNGGYPGMGFEGQTGSRYSTPAAPRMGTRPYPMPPQGQAPNRVGAQPGQQGVGSLNRRVRGPSIPQSNTQQVQYSVPQGGRY